jgi:hypothetical protein
MPKKCDQLEVIEEEMPVINHLEKNVTGGGGFTLFGIDVPVGFKLLLKKAGIYGQDKSVTPHIMMRFTGSYIDEFTGEYSHILDKELSSGSILMCDIFNISDIDGLEIGGWVMFDFVPV